MEQRLAESMARRAHVVLGKSSWQRSEDDPKVEKALTLAHRFYNSIESRIGSPDITGGTTSSPDDVIILFWEVSGATKIFGIYVTFKTNGKCSIEFIDGNRSRELDDLTFDEVVAFDVPSKYASLERDAGQKFKPYRLER